MMRFSKLFLIVLMKVLPFALFAQKAITDSVFVIDDVKVTASRLAEQYTGGSVQKIDSSLVLLYTQRSVADLLSDASGTSVRMYGPSGLASVSVRGGGAAHTPVIWNGINLQSPMNGGVNLSTLPIGLVNNVSIQYGGSGTLYGSGSLSGAVHLLPSNLANTPKSLSVGASVGSFGAKGGNLSLKSGSNNHHVQVNGIYKVADNDFKFENSAKYGYPTEEQTNAHMAQQGASANYLGSFSDALKLTAAVLYSSNHIHVPTKMIDSNVNSETQTDNNAMSSINLRYCAQSTSLTYKNGFIYNQVLYQNPSLSLNTDNQSRSFINELEMKQSLGNNHSLSVGANHSNEKGSSNAYGNDPLRNRLSLYAFYKLKVAHQFEWTTSARQEWSNGDAFPLVYGTGFVWSLAPWLDLKSCGATTYRLPTFNDLYWSDAFSQGNPYLNPESGLSADASLVQHFNNRGYRFSFTETVFANRFRNYIAWLPEGSIWMPSNKDAGSSKGLELKADWELRSARYKWMAQANYAYTQSVIESNDAYNKKPMIYVPDHKLGCLAGFEHPWATAMLQVNYTGYRYYDNINQLSPFTIVNLHVSRSFKWGEKSFNTAAHLLNLTNASYQVMAWYAMPPRNYSFSISMTI